MPLLNEWLAYFQIRPTASPIYRHAQAAGWVELFKIRFSSWFAHVVWAIYHFLTRHEETRELNDFVLRWLTPEEQAEEAIYKEQDANDRIMSVMRMYGKPVKNDND